METKNVYLETYGCTANRNNSEIISGVLARAGFIVTNNIELADILIINSCVVKGKTENKIKRRIQDISKEHKNKLIIISGCLSQTDFKRLKKLNKNLLFLGANHFREILNLIRDYYEHQFDDNKQKEYLSEIREIKLNLPKNPENKLISITQISEGCLGECSYCKTRLAKGKLYSYKEEEILKSIESDLMNGAKEVWITSQDNAAYGIDRENKKDKKSELPELLKNILGLKHNFKLRLGMMDPNNVLPIISELIEIYKNKKMYKFLHIPIQSASNPVLKHMNRFYSIEEASSIIEKFRKEIPDITIATDIIVGYPTETQEDHIKNLQFIRKYKPDVLNLSKFSSHKTTKAGKLKMLDGKTINARAKELMQVHRETAKENKEKYFGKEIKVFVNRRIGENLCESRMDNYGIVLVKCKKEDFGKEINVKIQEIGVHHLLGDIIQD